ncbi:MAG: hypothetical protein WC584_02140 [Candidatus Pacearchaeota archaeon]
MMRKKGSHVGVVLSFVIFVVFLVFLFSALQPALKIEKDKEAILEYISNSIIELSSENMTIENINYTVQLPNPPEKQIDCAGVLDNSQTGEKVIVKNIADGIVPYSIIGGNIIIYDLKLGKNSFKIYHSKSIIDQSSAGTCERTTSDYQINFINKETIISISKFSEIANRNYNSLKQELGISQKEDFSFSLLNADKINITEIKNITITANVYVNEFPVLYSNENGEIKSGFINVRVW